MSKLLPKMDEEGEPKADEPSKYCKATNRDIKIYQCGRDLKSDIDNARQSRLSNKLDESIDYRAEVLTRGYKIRELVGSGSYAHVFRAKDIANKREVALKLIELEKCSKHYRDVFLRAEIHVIRQLHHENIVHFFHAFNLPNAYVMVMEYVENGTFADLLSKKGVFSEKVGKKLFTGIMSGLNYMHSLSIAHRDLKLENLLLNGEYIGKISDFSLSIIWDRKKLCTSWCGTPPYFPPEIIQKKPYNPLSYDVWSIAVCIFIVFNDTIPFMCTDDQVMVQKQLKKDYKFRAKYEPYLSNNLKSLIRMMLEPDMNLRPTMGEVCTHKWFTSD